MMLAVLSEAVLQWAGKHKWKTINNILLKLPINFHIATLSHRGWLKSPPTRPVRAGA